MVPFSLFSIEHSEETCSALGCYGSHKERWDIGLVRKACGAGYYVVAHVPTVSTKVIGLKGQFIINWQGFKAIGDRHYRH